MLADRPAYGRCPTEFLRWSHRQLLPSYFGRIHGRSADGKCPHMALHRSEVASAASPSPGIGGLANPPRPKADFLAPLAVLRIKVRSTPSLLESDILN